MEKFIERISGAIPHTNKTVDITLDGRNLIVTGANGSGKTSFLRAVYEKVDLLIAQKQLANLPKLKDDLQHLEIALLKNQEDAASRDHFLRCISNTKKDIEKIETGLQIIIPNNIEFSEKYDDKKAVIYFFDEDRLSEITKPDAAKGLSNEEENAKKQSPTQKFANNLEQHLVNLINRQSLAITKDKNQNFADKIAAWFVNFQSSLRVLFEDDTITLDYDADNIQFIICSNNKPSYTFQQLSAGYSAIFAVYADLIMRTEYFKVLPSELSGVVFIDEIDSHLHVSLQRSILPFFTESFPQIQFIVTTHSPFVLMSTPDAIVFDLAKNEPIAEDLSYYTYSAVMEGLWNVKPIPVRVENDIREIAEIVNSKNKNIARLDELIKKIKGREDMLDNESKAFFMLGLEALEESINNV
jgi:predicted ATP-binding protein involved in virulence